MKNVSIIVPVYNASETIHTCLDAILNLDYPQELLEIIVVNDGSEDDTSEVVQKYNVRLIENKSNLGKGSALINGIKNFINLLN